MTLNAVLSNIVVLNPKKTQSKSSVKFIPRKYENNSRGISKIKKNFEIIFDNFEGIRHEEYLDFLDEEKIYPERQKSLEVLNVKSSLKKDRI